MNHDEKRQVSDLEEQVNLLNPLVPAINNTIDGFTQNVLFSSFFTINGGSSSGQGGTYQVVVPHRQPFPPQVIVHFDTNDPAGRYRQTPGIRAYDLTTVDTNGANDGSKIIGIWEYVEVEVDDTNIYISINWANPSWYPTSPGSYTVQDLSGHLYVTNIPLGTQELFANIQTDKDDYEQVSTEY